jgi:hypothetical protein
LSAEPLHRLVAADALLQLDGGRAYIDRQLVAEGFDASPIQAQGKVRLALAAVALHKAAMGIFATGVALDDPLAEHGARCVLRVTQVELAEPTQGVEVGKPKALACEDGPVLVRVIGEEIPLVKGSGKLILGGSQGRLARLLKFPPAADGALELLDVQP